MADEEQRAAGCAALVAQQIEECALPFRVQRRGRFVSDDDLGAGRSAPVPPRPAAAGRRSARRRACQQHSSRSRCRQQALRLAAAERGCRRPEMRAGPDEAAGQEHVVDHREVGNEVELLKDETDVVGTKAVADRGFNRGPICVPSRQRGRIRAQTPPRKASRVLLPLPLGPYRKTRSPDPIPNSGRSRQGAWSGRQRNTTSRIATASPILTGEVRASWRSGWRCPGPCASRSGPRCAGCRGRRRTGAP